MSCLVASSSKLRKEELQHLQKQPSELFQLQKAEYKRTLSLTTLNHGHNSWGFPNLLVLEVLKVFWWVQPFVFLWFVWNSLPSFIPYDPFFSLPFSTLPLQPTLTANLKDLKRKYHSHQGLIIITKIDPIWCLQRWGVRLHFSCTLQGWCGNIISFTLHSPSLRWAQPARTKNFYSPGFNRPSSHAFSISSTVFQEQQDSEVWNALKNTFHLIPCWQNPCSNLSLSSCLLLLIQSFLLCL